ncbi:hypothetical protein AVEN_11386-1 [Araneus ventricosus]|uniref:Secreted protein n=1 Tax=Araneus ventricosus TaxID=182803 RepID=A0A4Y2HDF0_ARAVE|nr:hypothetical protein AVEN_11386-1 [Araneus ventricosus]
MWRSSQHRAHSPLKLALTRLSLLVLNPWAEWTCRTRAMLLQVRIMSTATLSIRSARTTDETDGPAGSPLFCALAVRNSSAAALSTSVHGTSRATAIWDSVLDNS